MNTLCIYYLITILSLLQPLVVCESKTTEDGLSIPDLDDEDSDDTSMSDDSTTPIPSDMQSQIESKKQDFCAYSQSIDAATMSTSDFNKVLLFTGAHYFEMDLETTALVKTKKIKDTWPELDGNIDAACSVTAREPGGFLFTKGSTFWLYLSATEPLLVNTSHMNDYLKYYGMDANSGDKIACLACYCKDFYDCKVTAMFKNDRSKSITCNFDLYLNLADCQQKPFPRGPGDLSEDLLRDLGYCKGMSYVVGVVTPSTVFYVDDVYMHFWKGNNKIYTKPVSELFGCFTNLSMAVAMVGGVILVLVIVVIVVVIVVYLTKSSKGMDDDVTVVTDAYVPDHKAKIGAPNDDKMKLKDKRNKKIKRLNI
ncbi:hypothetical protein B4U80_13190 [Leptotrombidium deliense]|uniref:Uncharacterized protein n=1 Tax=Leptotrombidium deliense TaxID=299467 RepID=A0A443SAT6_9ACAR|nr:hypothetical protein B4U80_13190 [Leptotrombidium deliense]